MAAWDVQTKGEIPIFYLEGTVHPAGREPTTQTWTAAAKAVVAYTLAYLVVDVALNRFAFSDGWTLVWPLNGVNVALLLMRPRSAWPWMLLGMELGTGIGECLDDNTLYMATCLRICSGIEVLISALLLPPFSALDRWLRTPGIFTRFFTALVLGPGISGVIAAVLFFAATGQPFWSGFDAWAGADAVGMAATIPLTLALRSPQMQNLFQRAALPRTLGVLVLAFAGAEVIFSVSRISLIFLLYPLLLLVDSLLAFAGSAVAVVGVLLISVYFTTDGLGPFGVWNADHPMSRDVAFQLYFGFHLVALFPASIMFMERRRMAEELHDTNARLTVLAALDGLTGIANRRDRKSVV